jgi:predicted MFS family arabinose efflux permease
MEHQPPRIPSAITWLALGAFAIGSESFVIAGILRELAGDLRVSIPVAGQLVTAFALAYALAAPTLSVLTGSLRRQRVLAAAMGAFALANLLAAAAPSYGTLMASRILLAACAGLYMPTASAYAAAAVPPAQRGRALSLVYAGLTAAIVLGVPLGTFIGHHLSWRSTFLAVAALALVAFAGVARFVPAQAPAPQVGFAARLAVLRRLDVLLGLLVTVLAMAAAFTVYTYLALFLLRTTGIAGDRVSFVLLAFGGGGALGNLLGGYASDRMPPQRAVTFALTIASVTLAALSAAAFLPRSLALFAIPALIATWGIAGWAFTPAQQARLVALAPASAPIVLSFNAAAVYVGISLGSVLGSLIVAYGSVLWLGWAGGACGLLALALLQLPVRLASPLPAALGEVKAS